MLPAPHLDDRRFQDLVDDAKRMVQARCPEWTDHNVSDPGVTLIETFAYMTDALLYRLDRVPDRLYLAFLDLLGVTLHPPTAARVDVTFWLSAPQPEPVALPAGTEVATIRSEQDDAVVFATTRELVVPPRRLEHVVTQESDGTPVTRADDLVAGTVFGAFAPHPAPGDVLRLGLDDAAPSCAVALRFDCDVQGVGVDPQYPPLVWEAWDGERWTECDVEADGTGGLNKAGDVVLHLPPTHEAAVLDGLRGGWLRCRVVDAQPGYPFYSASPTVRSVTARTVGGTAPARHAQSVSDEVLGLAEGVPGQTFTVAHSPIVADDEPLTLEVAGSDGWETWSEVSSFAGTGPLDRVFVVDRAAGQVQLPPAVRAPDGTLTHYGAVPGVGAQVRLPAYRTGGGPAGNVAAHAVRVLRRGIPYVDAVDNRRPAVGGVAGETVEEARRRGPIALRTRDRAVTAEDYEQLARDAAPHLARVRCLPAGDASAGVRVLLVPDAVPDDRGRLRFADLDPTPATLAAVVSRLEECRTVGARVVVEPPSYQGVTVVARVTASPRAVPATVEAAAVRALHAYVDPLRGGRDGTGWPFGRAVQAGEIFAVLQVVPGVETVDDVLLFAADPITGDRGDPVQRVDLDPGALAFSYQHQVRVGGRS